MTNLIVLRDQIGDELLDAAGVLSEFITDAAAQTVEKACHRPGSVVWRLLHADLTGQAYVQAFAHRSPFDQHPFVTGCVTAGFDHGLLAELKRQEPL